MFPYSNKSISKLKNVHPKVVALLFLMAKEMDLTIIEGERSKERQDELFQEGFSKVRYPNSKHNIQQGDIWCRAVDVVPASTLYKDIGEFEKMGILLKKCASELNISVRWGGDWNWKDYAHFELGANE